VRSLALLLPVLAAVCPAHAQQTAPAAPAAPPPAQGTPLRSTIPDVPIPKFNTTVVPKVTTPAPPPAAAPSLSALMTADGQRIDSGLVWRVFLEKGGPDGRNKLVTESRVPAPTVRLAPGDYLINAAFGRAHLTRRLTVKAGEMPPERFVLNAGGLRLSALVGNGQPAPPGTVFFDVFSDERDQFGNRNRILSGAKAGVIVRLNSGIYNVVSTYGDANAILRTDVSVEAGKLTEATVAHAVGKATFKLVMRAGGEALADTQWTITTPQGDIVKESVGALPTHMLAPGNYVVNARSQGRSFRREFTLQHSEAVQVEVLVQ
jgi:hypothetical protein